MTDQQATEYALAKQVPAMRDGCQISTRYGDIELTPEEALALSVSVDMILRRRQNPDKTPHEEKERIMRERADAAGFGIGTKVICELGQGIIIDLNPNQYDKDDFWVCVFIDAERNREFINISQLSPAADAA